MSSPPTAAEIRRQFIDFFVERGHTDVPSMPVFPQDDPTLLFTNAGMNQFKDVFLGLGERPYVRAVDTQKCIRASGKHNDLEDVGHDTYHHTFFEMLGNWSFGDYFKRDAIVWAWTILTDVWKLPKERLWVSVFGGDEADGLPADEEAERIWREETDIDPARILRFDKRDNFWEMGETGPCGPCTEIHIDRGEAGVPIEQCDPADGANPEIGVNAGNERFIELWNLVFMEFNRLTDGSLKKLPAQHVDTGMGLERIVSVLQGVRSNYDTDLFTPIFDRLGELCGKTYGSGNEAEDIAFRVCADHMRAVSTAIADGALPSNTGRGYVLRRLIRRAARYGRQTLGLEDPFLHELIPAVDTVLGETFPEVRQRVEHVAMLVREEEANFARTLGRGMLRFDKLAGQVEQAGGSELPGETSYELYATFGLPQDLVELMCRERGLTLDLEGWHQAESAHQEASKTEGRFQQILGPEEIEGLPATERLYHDAERLLEADVTVVAVFPDKGRGDVLVLDASPFYPEGGGQVGDRGEVTSADGTFRFLVQDTQVMGHVVVHLGEAQGHAAAGASVHASVDRELREASRNNHTATHLLQTALREVLGDHVTQSGSYVGPDRLRFDFSHPKGLSPEELDAVEAAVNLRVRSNATLNAAVERTEDAKARGVTALFGEKYGDEARVVEVGDSLEFCGGTHVDAAGDIGTFVITSESAIQAGVRRIEAVTGAGAVAHLQHQRALLREASRALKVGAEDVPERIADLQKTVKEAKKKAKAGAAADTTAVYAQLKEAAREVDGVLTAVLDLPDMDAGGLRELGSKAPNLGPDLAIALFGRAGDKVPFLILCKGSAVEKGHHAGQLAQKVKAHIGGGGGGKPESAQGAGQDATGVAAAIEELTAALQGG